MVVEGKKFAAKTAGLTIVGTNPTQQQIIAFINDQIPPASYPTNSSYAYVYVIQQIASVESGFQQFTTLATPLFNQEGDGGVGIMQVTPGKGDFQPEDVWDWKSNIIDGIKTFSDKLERASTFIADPDVSIPGLSAQLRATQKKLGLSAIGFAQFTPDQFVREAVHYYNGGTAYFPVRDSKHALVVDVTNGIGTVPLYDIGGYDTTVLGPEIASS